MDRIPVLEIARVTGMNHADAELSVLRQLSGGPGYYQIG